MLFQGANKSVGGTTLATSSKSNTKTVTKSVVKKKDGFIVYSIKQFYSLLVGCWNRFRKFMWVGSTGFIILIVPFVFAYMQQMQNQMMKMMEMQSGNRMM